MNEKPTPEHLLALAEWRIRELETGKVPSAEGAIKDAIEIYRTLASLQKQQAQVYTELQARAKKIVNEIMAETQILKWETPFGSAYIPAPSISVAYDAKGIDALCEQRPDLRDLLAPYRQERERPGSLTIR